MDIQVLKNVTVKETNLPEGSCTTFHIGKQIFSGTNTVLMKIFQSKLYRTKYRIDAKACDREYHSVYFTPPNGTLDVKSKHLYTLKQKGVFIMENKKVTHLNLLRKPCVEVDIANDCHTRCFNKQLFLSKIPCRLPFMPSLGAMAMCNNSRDGSVAMNTYMNIASPFNPLTQTDCSCLPSCTNIITNVVSYTEPQDILSYTFIVFGFTSNVIEHFIENRVDSLSKLLCDVGGNLGLTLGVSVLSLFDLMQSLIAITFRFLHRQRETRA